MLKGSCLCGAIRYRITGPVFRMSHCHCSMCRKGHGAAFGTYLNTAPEHFEFERGEENVGRYTSSPGVIRSFCTVCGSTLQWYETRPGAAIGIAAGTLDDDPGLRADKHIYVASKAPWYELPDDGLARDAGPLPG
jgi:hypothetical protein